VVCDSSSYGDAIALDGKIKVENGPTQQQVTDDTSDKIDLHSPRISQPADNAKHRSHASRQAMKQVRRSN
jgi:hypothetical protein